jgi:hypothetical protein
MPPPISPSKAVKDPGTLNHLGIEPPLWLTEIRWIPSLRQPIRIKIGMIKLTVLLLIGQKACRPKDLQEIR